MTSSGSVMQNFLDMAQEIQRRDLTGGGIVNQNLILSSSSRAQGDVVLNASGTFNGRTNFSSAHLIGGGLWRQHVSSSTLGFFTNVHTSIPYDNTKPQNTEGAQVLVATITPVNANSKLRITAKVFLCEPSNVCDQVALTLFKDGDADAICIAPEERNATSGLRSVDLECVVSAADTSQRNYSVRWGANIADCISVNGCSGLLYGVLVESSLKIDEFEGR